jgi:hypothetical protein
VFKHRLVNRHKKKEEKEAGSRDWSDRWQNDLVGRRYRELRNVMIDKRNGKRKYDCVGEHYHAVMAVEGNHGWSDQQITDAIDKIEADRKREWGGESLFGVVLA